jgi:hypothetical protein
MSGVNEVLENIRRQIQLAKERIAIYENGEMVTYDLGASPPANRTQYTLKIERDLLESLEMAEKHIRETFHT